MLFAGRASPTTPLSPVVPQGSFNRVPSGVPRPVQRGGINNASFSGIGNGSLNGGGGAYHGAHGASAGTRQLVAAALVVLLAAVVMRVAVGDTREIGKWVGKVARGKAGNWRAVAGVFAVQVAAGRADTHRAAAYGVDAAGLAAILCAVFWYHESFAAACLGVAVAVFLPAVWERLTGRSARDATLVPAAAELRVVVVSLLMRATWAFYRDVFGLVLAHSGKRVPLAYAGCALVFLVHAALATALATFAALLVPEAVAAASSSSAGAALQRAAAAVHGQQTGTSITALLATAVVSTYALYNNFPQARSSWFW